MKTSEIVSRLISENYDDILARTVPNAYTWDDIMDIAANNCEFPYELYLACPNLGQDTCIDYDTNDILVVEGNYYGETFDGKYRKMLDISLTESSYNQATGKWDPTKFYARGYLEGRGDTIDVFRTNKFGAITYPSIYGKDADDIKKEAEELRMAIAEELNIGKPPGYDPS